MNHHDRRRLLDLVERAEWQLQARPSDAFVVPLVPGWALSHRELDGRHVYALLTSDGRLLRGSPGVVLRHLVKTGWTRRARELLRAHELVRGAA